MHIEQVGKLLLSLWHAQHYATFNIITRNFIKKRNFSLSDSIFYCMKITRHILHIFKL